MPNEGVEIQLQILTLTLEEGKWLASCSSHFVTRKEAPVPIQAG